MNNWGINVSSCFKLLSFDTNDLKLLTAVYRVMYPERRIEESNLVETIYKFGSFIIWSTTYGCKNATKRNKFCQDTSILASKEWTSPSRRVFLNFFLFPGIVQYYFTHSIKLGEEHVAHYFACVRWFLAHEESYFANPIKIYKNKFHPGGPASFMPLQRVFSRFASAELELEGQQTIAVAQITRNVFL